MTQLGRSLICWLTIGLFVAISATMLTPAVRAQSDSGKAEDLPDTLPERVINLLAEQERRIEELEQQQFERPVHPTIDRLREVISELQTQIQTYRGFGEERAQKLENVTEELRQVENIEAEQEWDRVRLTLDEAILFEPGEAELLPSSRNALNSIIDTLQENPNLLIQVEGHTDDQPIRNSPFESNWELSAVRAVRVVEYLTEETGLDGSRFQALGFGPHRPLVPNTSAENRRRNRRVEISLIPQDVWGGSNEQEN